MRLGTRQVCIESSLMILGVYQDGTREFAERRQRLTERLSGLAKRLAGSWEGLKVDVLAIMIDFTEGIGKITRNTPLEIPEVVGLRE
ncbi:hypothetical protein BHM03_00054831 [Ensete ventricosum]|nr:hypothetical protein BHM03_00054831 [Ensete ventricosum]